MKIRIQRRGTRFIIQIKSIGNVWIPANTTLYIGVINEIPKSAINAMERIIKSYKVGEIDKYGNPTQETVLEKTIE